MSASAPRPERPEKPKSKVGLFIGLAVAVVIAIIAVFTLLKLFANDNGGSTTGGQANGSESSETGNGGATEALEPPTKVKLGVNDIGEDHWQVLVDLAAEENIEVELISFTDYSTPNPALSDGSVDINKFQHVRYLAQYNATQGGDLVPIGASEIFPISIFSLKWDSLEDVPEGGEVTLSNNPANQVRPLLALYNAGLIALTKEADWDITIDDIDYANSKLGKVTPIDPSQTAASLQSVDLAFVDTPFQLAAGLSRDRVVYQEDVDRPDLQQYVNIFAVRGEDAGNAVLKRVAELYHSAEVRASITSNPEYDGVFKEDTQEQLIEVLEAQISEFQ